LTPFRRPLVSQHPIDFPQLQTSRIAFVPHAKDKACPTSFRVIRQSRSRLRSHRSHPSCKRFPAWHIVPRNQGARFVERHDFSRAASNRNNSRPVGDASFHLSSRAESRDLIFPSVIPSGVEGPCVWLRPAKVPHVSCTLRNVGCANFGKGTTSVLP
jgi:hypothetical protein